jgi:hypothetical protein
LTGSNSHNSACTGTSAAGAACGAACGAYLLLQAACISSPISGMNNALFNLTSLIYFSCLDIFLPQGAHAPNSFSKYINNFQFCQEKFKEF